MKRINILTSALLISMMTITACGSAQLDSSTGNDSSNVVQRFEKTQPSNPSNNESAQVEAENNGQNELANSLDQNGMANSLDQNGMANSLDQNGMANSLDQNGMANSLDRNELTNSIDQDGAQQVTEEAQVGDTEELTLEGILQDSNWELVMEKKFDFKCHDALYYDLGKSIAVGYAGEIHYLDAENDSWPDSLNKSLCRFGISVIDDNTIYVTGNSNVIKSTDGGKTFEKMTNFESTEFATMVDFTSENTGIAASKNILGITTNGAMTWRYITLPADKDIICIKMMNDTSFLYVDNSLTIHITNDSGNNWTSKELNLPASDDYVVSKKSIEIVNNADNSYTIYCIQKGTSLLKSYSTSDFTSYSEDELPQIKVNGDYIHAEGDYLTLFRTAGKYMTVLARK